MNNLIQSERTAWIPVIGEAVTRSQFGGTPELPDGLWPRCGDCQTEMPLFLQLDLASLPAASSLGGQTGLLQLFNCIACDGAYEPFTKCQLTRIVGAGVVSARNPFLKRFPVKYIVGWNAVADHPAAEEVDWQPRAQVLTGDKLGGWPCWVQGVEYPDCRECQTRMTYHFQLDSNCNLDWMFGDVGCGHIFRCVFHPTILSFHWACG